MIKIDNPTIQGILERVQQEHQLEDMELIYSGHYYVQGHVRNAILNCIYQGHNAAIKIYDDPRQDFEPSSLAAFNEHNKSEILTAPKVFAWEELTPQQGWVLMERLPEGAKRYEQMLGPNERKEFLDLFREYRKHFPTEPTRELTLTERLPADDFSINRLNYWHRLATLREYKEFMDSGERSVDPTILTDLFVRTVAAMRKVFANRKMIWSHGHFKGHEVFKAGDNQFFLIDFAHTAMFPEGYELAFMVWADYLNAPGNFGMDFDAWVKGVDAWMDELRSLAEELGVEESETLLQASMLERSMACILADVMASDRPIEEKRARIDLLSRLVERCLSALE